MDRLHDASKKNDERAARYTYLQETHHFEIDKTGARKATGTDTWDVLLLEGSPYKKHVAHDGKPLALKEAAKEEKKLQQTAAERKKARSGLFQHRYTFGWNDDDVKRLFDCVLAEKGEIRGHATQAVGCTPKSGYIPANKHERETMCFRQKLWLDETSGNAVRMEIAVVGEGIAMKVGTIFTLDFELVGNEAWLPFSDVSDFRLQVAKVVKVAGHDETTYSNFRRFEAESTIIDTK